MNNNHSPTILLGYQRSGTTALASILNKAFRDYGGLFTINGKIFYYLERWLDTKDINIQHFRADEIIHGLKRIVPFGEGIETWLRKVESVLNNISHEVADGLKSDSISLARRIILESYDNKVLWGDKYNEYLQQLPYILKLFPDTKFILLIRNPFEVSDSILNWENEKPWKPRDERNNLIKWQKWHVEWLETIKALNKDNYIVVEYERMCKGEETQRLSHFINIDLTRYFNSIILKSKLSDERVLPKSIEGTWEELLLSLKFRI